MVNKKIPMLKSRDIEKVLRKLGFEKERQSGSHCFFIHDDGRTTIIPKHGGDDIGRGLLRAILRQIEISPERFISLL